MTEVFLLTFDHRAVAWEGPRRAHQPDHEGLTCTHRRAGPPHLEVGTHHSYTQGETQHILIMHTHTHVQFGVQLYHLILLYNSLVF